MQKELHNVLRKKLSFRTKICEFRDERILKIGLFHRVKDLLKSNQIWHAIFPVRIKSFFTAR